HRVVRDEEGDARLAGVAACGAKVMRGARRGAAAWAAAWVAARAARFARAGAIEDAHLHTSEECGTGVIPVAFEFAGEVQAVAFAQWVPFELVGSEDAGNAGDSARSHTAAERDGEAVVGAHPRSKLAKPGVGMPDGGEHHFFADILGGRLFSLGEGHRDGSEDIEREAEAIEASAEVGARGGHADSDGGGVHEAPRDFVRRRHDNGRVARDERNAKAAPASAGMEAMSVQRRAEFGAEGFNTPAGDSDRSAPLRVVRVEERHL